MITFFRNFFSSKFGLALTLGFLALIAFAFASSDVANQATFGGVSGGDSVAIVGNEKIGNANFMRSVSSTIDQIREDNPTITIPAFAEGGGFEQVLEQMIDRYAISGYARTIGLRAGENLINSEILQMAGFRGPDGNFSTETFQLALRQMGLNEAMFRKDLEDSVLVRQMLIPSLSGIQMPQKFAIRYAALLRENRTGSIGFIPSTSFAPTSDPLSQELETFYQENIQNYIRPERRSLRFAVFGEENIDTDVTPTNDEILERYNRDIEQYMANEERVFSQLIVPSLEQATDIIQKVRNGELLNSIARQAGFEATQIGPIDKNSYSNQTSVAVADAVFSARNREVAEPAQSALGWHIVQIENVKRIAERPLNSVRFEINNALLAEKRAFALADLSARVEERLNGGVPLTEVANDLGIVATEISPITADGRLYDDPNSNLPIDLAGAVDTAFQMAEGEPQLAEVERGKTFMIFEVAEISLSAAAPLDEVIEKVTRDWRLSEGSILAKQASDRILEKLQNNDSLRSVFQSEDTRLPPVDELNLNRQQLLAQGQQIPPALALMFSMAENTAKVLKAPNDAGWFVVQLNNIQTPEVDLADPIVEGARDQLRGTISNEYVQQLTMSIRAAQGVEVNSSAVGAVRRQMTGDN
jgi:peptidyl-prolyl cis-trans isomerase D